MSKEMQVAVVRQLSAFGWKPLSGTAVASKEYPTAVGRKEALLYCIDRPQELFFEGNYWSEGRNALSTTWMSIPKDASPENVADRVKAYAAQLDKEVGSTYAARLLKEIA